MIVIGIVGGIASGKSIVAEKLGELGAVVLDGDKLGHAVLELPAVIQAARQRWGDEVLAAHEPPALDRGAIASRVFRPDEIGKADLEYWESVMHPQIGLQIESKLDKLPEETIVALDAAVMFKTGWDRLCDHVLLVDAPIELRQQRALARGWTVEQFQAREAAQINVTDKRRLADSVIANAGSLAETYRQVEAFWSSYLNAA